MAARLLLVAATTGYQTRMFAEAARRLGVELTLATDRCHVLDDPWGDRAVPVRFEEPEESAKKLAREVECEAVVAVGDRPAYVAALAAAEWGVPFHAPDAVAAAIDKFLARTRFQEAGMRAPGFVRVRVADGAEAARRAAFPCVLKPLGLSASRGVIRANNAEEFRAAFARIRKLLDGADEWIQVEDYLPGREFALEGIVTGGRLKPLALFDKPDPLEGPFFEETLYVTPSREPAAIQEAIIATTQQAVSALGLHHGPVHAEMRVDGSRVWMLEVAPRPIGGLCAKAVVFDGGMGLEELILRHAMGEGVGDARLEAGGCGVMMIPIPRNGVYQGVRGLDRAGAVAGIGEAIITAKQGQTLAKLPEGNSYLGFLFARGETPDAVEQSLRRAHAELEFEIAEALPTIPPDRV